MSVDCSDWCIEGSKLFLRLPSGELIVPTASEVVGAEFKGRLEIRGERIDNIPSTSLPTYTFAKYPPDLDLEVTPPGNDLQRPARCRLLLGVGPKRFPVPLEVLAVDQFLSGTDWYPIDPEIAGDIAQLLETTGIAVLGQLSLKQYLLLRQSGHGRVIFVEVPIEDETVPDQVPYVTPPTDLKAALYPYQQTGFIWLCRIVDEGLGCILGDEMGLGKTIQVIALLLREREGGRLPSLVIAPATLLENWRREFAHFAPTLSVYVHRGQDRTGFPSELRKWHIVVTSYETAVRDVSVLAMVQWNSIVLDEAQAIKNPDAQRTVTLKTLARRTAIAVSGTPFENHLRDLWSLMDFVIPNYLGNLHEFDVRYGDGIDDATALEPLISPLILRRYIRDVAQDLPQRIDVPQPIELSDSGADDYEALRRAIIETHGRSAPLVALTKLRMFCAHPFLLTGDGDPVDYSAKYARLLELLDEIFANGEKVLIFTSFVKMADILVADLGHRYNAPFNAIDGRTPVKDRQPIVDQFCGLTTPAGLILNPRAAGTGLNISAANHVIHYNLEWNPAVEDQATGRAHRRGQTLPVTVHRLFYVGTVEEVINDRVQRKRDIGGRAVVGTPGDVNDLADILRAVELSPVKGTLNVK